MPEQLKFGVLGAGKMATALIKGFLDAGLLRVDDVLAGDPIAGTREAFGSELGCKTTPSNSEVARFANVLLLAVKPDQATEALDSIRAHWTRDHLLISIAAGVPVSRIQSALNDEARIVRVMPNTPALVRASASAYALGTHATQQDGLLTQRLFSAVGVALEVKESLLDAVTGLSGGGPAYFYSIIEALSDGGVAAGLPRDVATKLAAQTALGAAKMVLETGLHPGVLKDMVTSPGGTTIEGLHQLEKAGVRGALINAVRAAAQKSSELGRKP